ncbi:MAG TPA: diacylglycerol kinase family protein [Gemmataceae bacterium]
MTGKTCVIYNPAAGRGQAAREVNRQRRCCGPGFYFRATREGGEAEEVALGAVAAGFDRVVAAGGDGTVHEVANGILRAGRTGTVFSVWPVGSANDYAYALGLTDWWRPGKRRLPRRVRSVDVGRVVAPGGRERYFVNGMGLGFNGAVTLESRRITWLRGMPLYTLAMLRAMRRHWAAPPMRVAFDDAAREGPTLALSVNLGKREGNFPITPDASLTDGLFDCIHVGPLSRWALLRLLPNMVFGVPPKDHPLVWLGRSRRVSVRSEAAFRVHLDGEFFCHPEDGVREVRVELLPARLRVETFP